MDPKEILSEAEVDELRRPAAPTADGPQPAGQVVDLHADHWERIPAGRVPALDSIAERIGSLLKLSARRFLRQPVEVTPRPARTERWSSYARRLPAPASLNVLEIRQRGVKGVITLDGEFVFTLADVFFGGTGQATRPATLVEFTPMEVRLVRKFVAGVLTDLREAWRPFMDLDCQLGNTEVSPIFAAVAASAEPMTIQTVELAFAGREFRFDVVLPSSLVEPIRFLRDAGGAKGRDSDPGRWQARLKADMQDAQVQLRAVVGRTEISLRDLTEARVGDILPIEEPTGVVLYAGETPLLEGSFGSSNSYNAVRISKPANRTTVGEKYGTSELD
jgi:flagellar motor switch protein FliM